MSRSLSVSRRGFLAGAGALAAGALPGLPRLAWAASPGTHLTAEDALQRLLAGNRRFAAGTAQQAGRTPADVRALAAAQNPIVAMLSCADSRVPPEIIFDQGLGDIFTVRTAGNYVLGSGAPVMGSLEYAVTQLNVPLVFILGHTQCGAIKAAVEHLNDEDLPDQIGALIAPLKPIVREARGSGDVLVADATRLNVRRGVNTLRMGTSLIAERAKAGKLHVVGGIYDLGTGVVTMTA